MAEYVNHITNTIVIKNDAEIEKLRQMLIEERDKVIELENKLKTYQSSECINSSQADNKDKSFIVISEKQWADFRESRAGIRTEIEQKTNKEYVDGYIKGFKSGIMDLLAITDIGEDKYRDDVDSLADNLRKVAGKHGLET